MSVCHVIKVIPQFSCVDEIAVLFFLSKFRSYDTVEGWEGYLHGQSKSRMVNLRRTAGLRHWLRSQRWDNALFNPE